MNYRVVGEFPQAYLECLPGDGKLAGEREALEMVGACGENGTDRLMLHDENLTGEFYDLRTRVAGEIMLKFSNYRIRVAAVIPPERVGEGHFQEMVWEQNRRGLFRFFHEREAAERWLIGA